MTEPVPDRTAELAALEREWKAQIDARLNRDRPRRSSPKDRAWMEPTLLWAIAHMPYEERILRMHAETVVYDREGRANRRANNMLKRYALGRAPLFWSDLGPLPFTIDQRDRVRIRFDAATPEDFFNWATEDEAAFRARAQAELARIAVVRELAEQATAAGYERVAQLGDLPRREDGRYTDLDWDDEGDDEDE